MTKEEIHSLSQCYASVISDMEIRRMMIEEKRAGCKEKECKTCLEAQLELGMIVQALQALDHFRP